MSTPAVREDHRARRAVPALLRVAFLGVALVVAAASARADDPALAGDTGALLQEIEVFTREGCPHCEAAHRFLEGLARERPGLRIVERHVDVDASSRARLRTLGDRHGVPVLGVPAFALRGRLVVGFDAAETTGRTLVALLDAPTAAADATPDDAGTDRTRDAATAVETRLFGTLRLERLGLPLFTVALGLVDGFNPCAMWVLLFLLSFLVHLRSRARMALVAGTFVLVSGLAYYLFMAAWLGLFLAVGLLRPVQVVLALVAAAVGALHVKEFFAFRRGPSLMIPESVKPGLYARMRAIVRAEDLPAALASAAVLAVLVNVVELLCTAGIPAVYTQILSQQEIPAWQHHAWLALYVAAYMADDAAMVALAVVTLGHRKLDERAGRWLELLSGLVMLGLATLLLLAPSWLF